MPRMKSPPKPSADPVNIQDLAQMVFKPGQGERIAFVHDAPTTAHPDHAVWQDRRALANEWRAALSAMDLDVLPLASYEATGAHNADLPGEIRVDDRTMTPAELADDVNLIIAFTEYSATAPLLNLLEGRDQLRAASMPGAARSMMKTALAADYQDVDRRAQYLRALLNRAVGARVRFNLGQECYFDLRFRQAHADGGLCHPDMAAPRLINLPAGEAFKVPYEGENPDEPTDTIGMIPIITKNNLSVLFVNGNIIEYVIGDGRDADQLNEYFSVDPARRNIAEIGFGCNPRAVISGNTLEDEKVGFHIAYGRSDHIGGTVGVDRFLKPENVVHKDLVYAHGAPVYAEHVLLVMDDGSEMDIIADGNYTVLD